MNSHGNTLWSVKRRAEVGGKIGEQRDPKSNLTSRIHPCFLGLGHLVSLFLWLFYP